MHSQRANTDNFVLPVSYRHPNQKRDDRDLDARRAKQQLAGNTFSQGLNLMGPGARPRKQLYVVTFKFARCDIFYLLDGTGLEVREGDLVIVEADRGQDLGTVLHARVTPEAAREYKKKLAEEQYRWLMMYSQNKNGGRNPNAHPHGDTPGHHMRQDAPGAMPGMMTRGGNDNLKAKAIKRLASEHEIHMLAEKEGNEAKAKRACQQKVANLRLEMEILEAEWQW